MNETREFFIEWVICPFCGKGICIQNKNYNHFVNNELKIKCFSCHNSFSYDEWKEKKFRRELL